MSLLQKIQEFLDDSERNSYEMKVKSKSSAGITMSVFDMSEFMLEIRGDGALDVVAVSDELKGQWEDNMKKLCPSRDVQALLQTATDEYTNLPDDLMGGNDSEMMSPLTPGMFSPVKSDQSVEDALKELVQGEDSLVDEEQTFQNEERQRKLAEADQKRMAEAQIRNKVDGFVDGMEKMGLKPTNFSSSSNDSNVKQLYITFYFDGFTITHDNDLTKLVELRDMEDDRQKPILKSLQAGYVPKEFAGNAKDVDVHMIYKQCKYIDRLKKEEELKEQREEYAKKMKEKQKKKDGDDDLKDRKQKKVVLDGFGEMSEEELRLQKLMLEKYMSKDKEEKKSPKKDQEPKSPKKKEEDQEVQSPQKIVKPQLPEEKKKPEGKQLAPKVVIHKTQTKPTPYKFDENKPSCNICFRVEGQRQVEKVNLCNTLQDIMNLAAQHIKVQYLEELHLVCHHKPLVNLQSTVKQLNIANAVILLSKH